MEPKNLWLLGIFLLFSSIALEWFLDFISDGIILYAGLINFAAMGIYAELIDMHNKYS